jgi:steroid 5-alpha reductase family enzyme
MNSQIWLAGFLAVIVLYQIMAIPALILRKNDLADVLWGPAFPLTAIASLYLGSNRVFADLDSRSVLLIMLITIWAIRLFTHVGWRNLFHLQEDIRYNNWRKQWGKTWVLRSYLQVFVLQALILYVFLSPILLSLSSPPQSMGFLAYLGLVVWVVGFLFESIADEQLRRFKKNTANKGKIMTQGLWSWSRHPNYFGEVVQWWGIWLMVLEIPYGWLTIVSPLGVTYIILKVSGVSMLEELMQSRVGFEEYKKRTSEFIPMPPKN